MRSNSVKSITVTIVTGMTQTVGQTQTHMSQLQNKTKGYLLFSVIGKFLPKTHITPLFVLFIQAFFVKGALAWYGKLTWESAHAWILKILCYLIV